MFFLTVLHLYHPGSNCWHQQESPIWVAVKKETLLIAKQLNCDTGCLWNCSQPAVRQPWSQTPLWLDISVLHLPGLVCFASSQQDTFGTSAQPKLIVGGKGSVLAEPGGSWLTETEAPAPGPWLAHSNANDSKSSMFWLVQKALSWLVRIKLLWLVVKGAGRLPTGWNKISGTPL